MATVIRYTGHASGYMDFYMVDERIMCEDTINQLTTQELWDAITSTEDEQLAFGYLGIAVADGKNPAISSALNVTLLRNWRVGTEKVDGAFKLTGGNTVSETLGTEPFEPNNLVFMTNQLSQFGTTISTGSVVTAQDKLDIAQEVWTNLVGAKVALDVDFIKQIEGGKWDIVGSEMIFYKEDNTTEIARFALAPNAASPITRTRL